jgi:hypothetical protein
MNFKLKRCNPDRLNRLREHIPLMGTKQVVMLARVLAARLTIVITSQEELFSLMRLFKKAFKKAEREYPHQAEYEAARTRLWMNWLEMTYVKLWRFGVHAADPFPFEDHLATMGPSEPPSMVLAEQLAKKKEATNFKGKQF